MAGITDLDELLGSLEPVQVQGEFVYVTSPEPDHSIPALAMVREAEAVTYVVRREDADQRGLTYDYVAAWITLQVHSSLEAIGLTAAVSQALATAGISCNVLAGQFHDHLLVPVDRADEALATLSTKSR